MTATTAKRLALRLLRSIPRLDPKTWLRAAASQQNPNPRSTEKDGET